MKYLHILFLLVVFSACAYDNAEDLYGEADCPPDGVSFTEQILPIIRNNCAVAGCHVEGRQLPTLETYDQIAANSEKIKFRTGNGTMPPGSSGKSLSQDEINLISCWVDSGSPDN